MSTFDDWHAHIDDCPVPFTLYEGSQSRLCDRHALCQFVADHAKTITFVGFETTGTTFPYVRPDLMISMIAACNAKSAQSDFLE